MVVASNMEVGESRKLLAKYRADAPRLGELHGRGVQAWLQEQWSELHTWCGSLAAKLDGSCACIEAVHDEKKRVELRVAELESSATFLEYICSQRNVRTLEEKVVVLQAHADGAVHVRDELEAARAEVAARELTIDEQRQTILATDASKSALESRLDEASAESERLRAELAEVRAASAAAAECAERLAEETREAHAATLRVAHDASEAAAAGEAALASEAAKAAAVEVVMVTQVRECDADVAAARTELEHTHELLGVERAARIEADARVKQLRRQLDAALRACKQSEDRVRRLSKNA